MNQAQTRYFLALLLAVLFLPIEPAPGLPDDLAFASNQRVDERWLSLVGQLSGDISAVTLDGTRAYAGMGATLLLLDVSQRATPRLLGRSAVLPAPIRALAAARAPTSAAPQNNTPASYLYLLAGYRLHVMDVRNPSQMASIGSYRLPDPVEDLVVISTAMASGTRVLAYVAAGDHGLAILDATDPAQISEIGYYDTPGHAWRVAIDSETISEQTFAYVTDEISYLHILDVSNPIHPALVSTYTGYADSLRAGGVAVSLGRAYVGSEGGFAVLDTHDPTQPQQLTYINLHGGFVTRLRRQGDYLFAFGFLGFVSYYRIPEATAPRYWYFDTHGEPWDIATAPPLPGQEIPLVYAASGSRGMQMIAWADPTHPVLLGEYDLPGQAYGVTTMRAGEEVFVFLTDRDHHLHIIDATNVRQPLSHALYDSNGVAWNVALTGDVAYVAAGDKSLRMVDVHERARPQELGSFSPSDSFIRDVAITGNYGYATDRMHGRLFVLGVADPARPIALSIFETPGGAYAVTAVENLIYLADGVAGLRIVDVSKPDSPFEAGSWQTPGVAVEVAVSGTLAFVAGREEGLHIVDVHDPARPQLVATYDTPGLVWGVAVEGAWVYLADGPAGVRVLDVTDPTRPREVAAYATPGYAWNVAVAGDQVYVAAEGGGLVILRHAVLLPLYLPLVRQGG